MQWSLLNILFWSTSPTRLLSADCLCVKTVQELECKVGESRGADVDHDSSSK